MLRGRKRGKSLARNPLPELFRNPYLFRQIPASKRPPEAKNSPSNHNIVSDPGYTRASQPDDGKSIASRNSKRSTSRLKLGMRRMEEEFAMKEQQLEAEKILSKRRMELEQRLAQKRFQQEKELQERRLVQEKAMLERQLAEEIDFQRKQRALQEKFQRDRYQLAVREVGSDDGAVGEEPNDFSEHESRKKANDWLIRRIDPEPRLKDLNECETEDQEVREYFKRAINDRLPTQHLQSTPTQEMRRVSPILQRQPDNRECRHQEPCLGTNQKHEEVSSTSTNSSRDGSGPTRAQRAARQVLSKKLPTFTGRSEDWPLFYSSYTNSADACGFSNVENLVRLQECLKGPALESVRSRLLLPNSVPQVIETLRMLYGKPEQLIHTLLNKVRKTDAPRSDRLETFVPFGMAVQELCDHLEAVNLQDHLVNPILIQELVDKLPAATKREWVQCRRLADRVTLRTFADFTSNIVAEASEVILVIDPKETASAKGDKSRLKEKGFVLAHSGASNTPAKYQLVCSICKKEGHRVRSRDIFRSMNSTERLKRKEEHKLCERCLNEHKGWCRFKINCNVGACREHHHPLVHRNTITKPSLKDTVPSITEQHHTHTTEQGSIIYRIVPITLHYKQRSVSTSAYLDEGSSMTLIEEGLVDSLNAKGRLQPLTLEWTSNIVRQEPNSICLTLQVSGCTTGQRSVLKEARTVKKLSLPRQRVNFKEITSQYSHLQGLDMANQEGDEPKILIGLNNVHLMAPLESKIGNINEPIAVRSYLGWTIYGPGGDSHPEGFLGCHRERNNQEQHFIVTENAGVSVNELPESSEIRRAGNL
ncbi:uncharacterized protein LOC129759762 isoform X1 [Uranotaenia lowii]|uniref:uncharacterized protein LOC129759762 isoform X1 n=1 Tax=Uranotaenia lowii TaxID=190385 RepID=UPI002478E651|nr:uncharacterized protein LOC129759762 isoform X1 [Uranotaenia lowii]XP_055613258.1 uncharacterized protein LOC129759762 isoform X1 [Uranotaenia lowii]XP_055613259.1 uncharacterized protein LOC129759762 isoform X1 [Uranotaenia lowii]